MIKLEIDGSGALSAIKKLRNGLLGVDMMGRILEHATSAIWIPLIVGRLNKSTATTAYENELDQSLQQLDKDFADWVDPYGTWTYQPEWKRRIAGGYRKGEITDNIESAIRASTPIAGEGYIAVGIGDISLLNDLAPIIGENSHFHIWEILQWGTGVYSPKGGSPIVRTGKQIFFDRKQDKGVMAYQTVNPGFRGREYFVQLDGDIHKADYAVRDYVLRYMRKIVKKYSYK